MDGLRHFFINTWPVLGALVLVGAITLGAFMPYIRAERRRRDKMEKDL